MYHLENKSKVTEWNDIVDIDASVSLKPKFSWLNGIHLDNTIYFQVISNEENDFISGTYTTDTWFQYYNLDNVVLNINTAIPEDLMLANQYNFTLMGVSVDNWVNLVIQKPFIAE